ncbi:AMP-binding protein [Oculatella sp. LEGE 06141]|uniref:long-chain fatty acid--CoA ligase n=1 Tax=Oculatella sp. LEGE 06141 TaxID=1828648 RepID=UPI001882D131|nr:long-chain fatty acid--CoA ligase [Oculatella sp. LEGE 06141]MBE9181225.1 AMP-binding protein [Oculatella sp. LEGE 06141]
MTSFSSPSSRPMSLAKGDAIANRDDLRRHLIDYSTIQSVPEIWAIAAQRANASTLVAVQDPHVKPTLTLTYAELYQKIRQFAAGLQALGVQEGDRISLFSDNSPRWLIADQGMMMAGAVNAVRSSQADRDELMFIMRNSGSTGLVVQDGATLAKLRSQLHDLPLRFVVLLTDEQPEPDDQVQLLSFSQLMTLGAAQPLQPVSLTPESLATLLYTSGTTGQPKGVMLTHGNLLHQVNMLGVVVQPHSGDRVLSILPTWHAYERTIEYFLLSQGCTQIYTNLRSVKQDMRQYKPHYMIGVPRLWESIYEAIQKQFREQPERKQKLVHTLLHSSQQYVEAKRIFENLSLNHLNTSPLERAIAGAKAAVYFPLHKLAGRLVYGKVREATGGNLKQVISGGGSLAMHLDTFFEIIDVEVLVGYGLTETAPVLTARRPWSNLRGSSGQPIPATEIRIVDPESRQLLPVGERGLVLARGPQIMKGYYQNPEATQKAIDPEGWFDTGDLGWLTPQGHLVLTGRAKDTIVLTNGENIEPQPIEDACIRSPYIDQIMLVGQDERSLGALIVPNLEALHAWAASQNLKLRSPNQAESEQPNGAELDLNSKLIQDLFRQELNREVKDRPGYRPDDRIGPFRLITEPFSIENGMMTQTLKVRRPVVTERYRGMIIDMFA